MFCELDNENFEFFAAKHYSNPACLTVEDFKKEILQWIGERSDECYLDDDCQIRRFDEHK